VCLYDTAACRLFFILVHSVDMIGLVYTPFFTLFLYLYYDLTQ
jgi:hypothetical protein